MSVKYYVDSSGNFLGASVGRADSLTEPEKPAPDAIEVPPPPHGRATWAGGTWVESKAVLKEHAKARRHAAEYGGIAVAGVAVATDAASQAKIKMALDLLAAGVIAGPIKFKADNGWFDLGQAALAAVVAAVALHVQACYAKEAEISAAIDAGTIATAAAIDAAAWPGSGA